MAGELSALLDGVSGSEEIDRVTEALLECGTGEEFIERVRVDGPQDMSHDVHQRIGIPVLVEQKIANRGVALPPIHRSLGLIAVAGKLRLIVAHADP